MTIHQIAYNEKHDYLLDILNQSPISYADGYKVEVLWFIESNFQPNEVIPFLIPLETKLEIKNYIDRITGRIVYREDEDSASDIIAEYILDFESFMK